MLQITVVKQGRGNKNLEYEGSLKQSLKRIFTKKRNLALFLGMLILIFCYPAGLSSKSTPVKEKRYEMKVSTKEEILELDKNLENEVKNYIAKNSFGSKLSGRNFINSCKKYNFDLILALSQAEIESHFGTMGIAARTNSVFNVGTFDDGTILYRYDHPDLSLSPYILLVKTKYMLDDKKKTHDLLKPMAFVNYKGKRYASLLSYESRVKGVFDKITSKTQIDELWKEVNNPKIKYYRDFWNSVDHFHSMIKARY